MRKLTLLLLLLGLALSMSTAQAQWTTNSNTTLSLAVAAEASIHVDDSTTTLAQLNGALPFDDYAGTTRFSYKVRTKNSGTITLYVATDFSPAGGPSVASPPTTGDALTYTCSHTGPGSGCSSAQTAAVGLANATPVATFGANARSVKAGHQSSVSWALTNDPQYLANNYTATVTFVIAAL
jgi:hypothetical protein